jgi:hypothetical protein
MTQASTGHLAPRIGVARILTVLRVIGSIVAIAVFTASAASTLAAGKLQGLITSASNLSTVRVSAVQNLAAEEDLTASRIAYMQFSSLQDGLMVIRGRTQDAFVSDGPLLTQIKREQFSSSATMFAMMFDHQMYCIARPAVKDPVWLSPGAASVPDDAHDGSRDMDELSLTKAERVLYTNA